MLCQKQQPERSSHCCYAVVFLLQQRAAEPVTSLMRLSFGIWSRHPSGPRHLSSTQPQQAEIRCLPAHPPAPRWYQDGLLQLRSSLIFLWCPHTQRNKSHPSKQSNNSVVKIKGATGTSLKAETSSKLSAAGYALVLGCAWEVPTTNTQSCKPHAEARVGASLAPSQLP